MWCVVGSGVLCRGSTSRAAHFLQLQHGGHKTVHPVPDPKPNPHITCICLKPNKSLTLRSPLPPNGEREANERTLPRPRAVTTVYGALTPTRRYAQSNGTTQEAPGTKPCARRNAIMDARARTAGTELATSSRWPIHPSMHTRRAHATLTGPACVCWRAARRPAPCPALRHEWSRRP